MQYFEYLVIDNDNFTFIYSGLNSISDSGREKLKNIAESLIAIQNRPGTPVPENISRDIIRDSTINTQTNISNN